MDSGTVSTLTITNETAQANMPPTAVGHPQGTSQAGASEYRFRSVTPQVVSSVVGVS